jgi:hypothetical protein
MVSNSSESAEVDEIWLLDIKVLFLLVEIGAGRRRLHVGSGIHDEIQSTLKSPNHDLDLDPDVSPFADRDSTGEEEEVREEESGTTGDVGVGNSECFFLVILSRKKNENKKSLMRLTRGDDGLAFLFFLAVGWLDGKCRRKSKGKEREREREREIKKGGKRDFRG